MKHWIARDNYGYLGLYKKYPTWGKVNECIEDWNGAFIASFPEVTFENSPQEVELKLVKK